jgi:predicted transcriptional regulator
MSNQKGLSLSDLTADIIAAYVGRHKVAPEAVPTLVVDVHGALARAPKLAAEPPSEAREPAVPVKQSVKKDYIVCLEDGKRFRSLKRHLKNEHDLTAEEYRTKWDLPYDYPMVAPSYSQSRSALAKSMGLGKKSTTAAKRSPRKRGQA